ncbi:MAG: fatty acid desaturase [Planctomycetota bacterium]|nr:MAG: fatty acid desaturase [Planctomycetota bacterium]
MSLASWRPLLAPYLRPNRGRAIRQLIDSVGSYLVLWALMAWTVTISWWLSIPIAILSGAVLVRVFIIFHDCGHGSFFASRRANRFWGRLTGVLSFTPFEQWRKEHATHHLSTGNLDRRGVGDIWTMTVEEYKSAKPMRRLSYRVARNPLVLLLIAPLVLFVLEQRIPKAGSKPEELRSVWWTTLFILVWGTAWSLLIGFLPFLILQLTILAVAGAIGIWLFYSQHQFDGAYWQRASDWDFETAALRGSAFLKLPRVLQWFTGNIGFHHIHHLDSRIPNYHLQACHESHPRFQEVEPLTLLGSLRAFGFKLWDEASGRLVGFDDIDLKPDRLAGC